MVGDSLCGVFLHHHIYLFFYSHRVFTLPVCTSGLRVQGNQIVRTAKAPYRIHPVIDRSVAQRATHLVYLCIPATPTLFNNI